MRPIVTDRVAWSVGLAICHSCSDSCKTAESIEVPFGLRTRVGPRNHVLDGVSDAPMGRGYLEGEGAAKTAKVWESATYRIIHRDSLGGVTD